MKKTIDEFHQKRLEDGSSSSGMESRDKVIIVDTFTQSGFDEERKYTTSSIEENIKMVKVGYDGSIYKETSSLDYTENSI